MNGCGIWILGSLQVPRSLRTGLRFSLLYMEGDCNKANSWWWFMPGEHLIMNLLCWNLIMHNWASIYNMLKELYSFSGYTVSQADTSADDCQQGESQGLDQRTVYVYAYCSSWVILIWIFSHPSLVMRVSVRSSHVPSVFLRMSYTPPTGSLSTYGCHVWLPCLITIEQTTSPWLHCCIRTELGKKKVYLGSQSDLT